MANPFAARCIEMGDGIASPKPSTTNLGGWSASRNLAPTSRPMPHAGARLTMVSPFREPRVVGPDGANTSRICPRQTARPLSPYPAPHEAGDMGTEDGQARASGVRCTPSPGLSFPLRPQRCQRAPRSGARSYGEKTADPGTNVGALAGVSNGVRWRCERALRQRLRLGRG